MKWQTGQFVLDWYLKSPVAHTEPILKKHESTQITRFVYFPFAEIILQIIQKQATSVF